MDVTNALGAIPCRIGRSALVVPWMEKGSSGKPHIGVILRLRKDTGTLQVIGLAPNGPAKQSGLLQENDVLLKIAGQVVGGMSAELATPLLEGPLGSRVRLKLSREGVPFDCTLTRAVVTSSQPIHKLSKRTNSNASDGSGRAASRSKKLTVPIPARAIHLVHLALPPAVDHGQEQASAPLVDGRGHR